MKICPRCNREYDEALENCLVCGNELTTYTPILSEEERATLNLEEEVTSDMLEEINPENLPEVICSVMGKEEAVRLSELLMEHHIPCMCKENGEEEDVFDLLIPKKNFNKALELLHEDEMNMESSEELPCEEDPMEEPAEEGEQSKPTLMKRILEWLFKN